MNLQEVRILSWESEIYAIYDKIKINSQKSSESEKMLPISHSTASAQIEVTIDEHGNMRSASAIDKEQSETIIPVTKDSIAKSSGICAHPLADKLIYIAGDYKDYAVGAEKDKAEEKFDAYITQLEDWAESDYAARGVKAVYNYLKQGRLIGDLIGTGLLVTDDTGKLDDKRKIGIAVQKDCFVRFRIQYDDFDKQSETWKDNEMYESFIDYLNSSETDGELCYATGRYLSPTYKHPSKIRNGGDKAKLISSNDESGFTYRGRFDSKEQALCVSYDFSQKFHNALKWLIQNQGIVFYSYYDDKTNETHHKKGYLDGMSIFAWSSSLEPLPNFAESAEEVFDFDNDENANDNAAEYDSMPLYMQKIKRMIFSKNEEAEVNADDKVMVMALDSAVTGRLNVSYYSELARSKFLENVANWHRNTSWLTYISKIEGRGINSFSVYEIVNRAFGGEIDGKLKCKPEVEKDNVLRLIPCIIEGRRIPADIVNALIRKASKPLSYDSTFNHNMVVNTACGMIRKRFKEEGRDIDMALDENCTDRNYLFGRLLAAAEKAELDTYDDSDTKSRVPNARRYWEKFVQSPYTTWERIYEKLDPYFQKLGNSNRYMRVINEIKANFTVESYADDSRLQPLYLLGYSHQMNEFYKKKDNKDKTENNDKIEKEE